MDITENKYKVPEAAQILGISAQNLWKRIGKKQVGVYRIGRCVRIGEREITRILTDGFTPAQQESAK